MTLYAMAWTSLFFLTLLHYSLGLSRLPWPRAFKALCLGLMVRWPVCAHLFWLSYLFQYLEPRHPLRKALRSVGLRVQRCGLGTLKGLSWAFGLWALFKTFTAPPQENSLLERGLESRMAAAVSPLDGHANCLDCPADVWHPCEGVGRFKLGKLDFLFTLKTGVWEEAALLWQRHAQERWVDLNRTSKLRMGIENRLCLSQEGASLPLASLTTEFSEWKWEKIEPGKTQLTFRGRPLAQTCELLKSYIFQDEGYEVGLEHRFKNISDKTLEASLDTVFHWAPQLLEGEALPFKLGPTTLNLFTDQPGVKAHKSWFFGNKRRLSPLPKLFSVEGFSYFEDHQGSIEQEGWAAWIQKPFVWYFPGETGEKWAVQATEMAMKAQSNPQICEPGEECCFYRPFYLGPLELEWVRKQGENFALCFDVAQRYKPLEALAARFFEKAADFTSSPGLAIILLGAFFFICFLFPIQCAQLQLGESDSQSSGVVNVLKLALAMLWLYIEMRGFILVREFFRYAYGIWGCPFLWEQDLSHTETYGFFLSLGMALTLLEVPLASNFLKPFAPQTQTPPRRREKLYVLLMGTSFSLSQLGGTSWGRDYFPFCPTDFKTLFGLALMAFLSGLPPETQSASKTPPVVEGLNQAVMQALLLIWMGRAVTAPLILFQIGRRSAQLVMMHFLQILIKLGSQTRLVLKG